MGLSEDSESVPCLSASTNARDQSLRLMICANITSCDSGEIFAKLAAKAGPTLASPVAPSSSMVRRCNSGDADEPTIFATLGTIPAFNWRTPSRLDTTCARCSSGSPASSSLPSSCCTSDFTSADIEPPLSQRAMSGRAEAGTAGFADLSVA